MFENIQRAVEFQLSLEYVCGNQSVWVVCSYDNNHFQEIMQPAHLSQQASQQPPVQPSTQIPVDVEPTSRHLSNKARLKIITSSTMNDTFANWRKKKKTKKESHINSLIDVADQDIILSRPSGSRTSSFRAMGGDQHFKCKSSSENNTLEHSSTALDSTIQEDDDIDGTKQYFQETFEINETDEDNYNQSKEVRTPGFNEPEPESTAMQKRIMHKYSKKHSKLKTETQEDCETLTLERTRARFPTMSSDQKEFKWPQKEQNKKNRASSNPQKGIDKTVTFTDFFKYEGDYKKCKILEKVKCDKDRIQDIKINEMGFVTKYASKFNINEEICRQIIRENGV